MSKYLDYDGLSHFKDKCDDTYIKTSDNPVVSAVIESKAILTDETADITSLVTATVEQGDWITTKGTDEEDYETPGDGLTYYYGDVTYTVTVTLSETQEADTTVIVRVALSYTSGVDVDDEGQLTHSYTNSVLNSNIVVSAGETIGMMTGTYKSLSVGSAIVSVTSATRSAYTEQQTLTVTHLDGTINSYTFDSGSTTTTSGVGLYEHRIAYKSQDDTYAFNIQFTFINNVSTPYIVDDMDDDELTEGVESLYNALITIMNKGDYISSNITDRWIPCIASATSYVFCAFRPSSCFSGSIYLTLFDTEGAEVTALLMNFVDVDDRPDFEDNVRTLITPGDGVGTSSVTASTTTDSDGNTVLVLS